MADPGKPTYMELLTLLRERIPRSGIQDDRYWAWDRRVQEVLDRAPEPK